MRGSFPEKFRVSKYNLVTGPKKLQEPSFTQSSTHNELSHKPTVRHYIQLNNENATLLLYLATVLAYFSEVIKGSQAIVGEAKAKERF